MNAKERELLNAINGTERMSGFDSYDEGNMSYFDDMDNFDGDEMSYADDDGMSYATGSKPTAISDPYVIMLQNTDLANNHTAVLFGYNDNFNVANYGNDPTVILTNLQGGTYGRLIAQSNNKFFKIGKWRFQSTTPAQLQVTMLITHTDANGKAYTTPLNLSIMRDAYQQQADIIDITKPVTIDGNTTLSFLLLASATIVISMFPTEILSGKARLNGGQSLNGARAPRLSGKNVAPVIIQTQQGVKGVSKA